MKAEALIVNDWV